MPARLRLVVLHRAVSASQSATRRSQVSMLLERLPQPQSTLPPNQQLPGSARTASASPRCHNHSWTVIVPRTDATWALALLLPCALTAHVRVLVCLRARAQSCANAVHHKHSYALSTCCRYCQQPRMPPVSFDCESDKIRFGDHIAAGGKKRNACQNARGCNPLGGTTRRTATRSSQVSMLLPCADLDNARPSAGLFEGTRPKLCECSSPQT
jgi:hypothetical protein